MWRQKSSCGCLCHLYVLENNGSPTDDLVVVCSYKDLKTFLNSFVKKCANPVTRSLLHIQLDYRKGIQLSEPPRWCPSRRMLSEAIGLLHKQDAIGPEIDIFLDQSLIGVC